MYLIMLSVKQGGIKYHFLSLLYDPTWDWTPISQTIGEHSTHLHIQKQKYFWKKGYMNVLQLIKDLHIVQ